MTAAPPLRGIDHVVLLVGDMARATEFYTEAIGCTIDNELPQYGMCQLRAGAALIDLVDISADEGAWARPEVPGGRNVDHVALALGPVDPEEVRRHLHNHGIEIIEEGERTGALGDTLSFYIRDPSGNQIELSFDPTYRA
jgi:catechol 2,3-dioxygenase-like lactoylglutathione lyase family enzyme